MGIQYSSKEDKSLWFKFPLEIRAYQIREADFKEDENTGLTYASEEDYQVEKLIIHSNKELMDLYEKAGDGAVFFPIPLDLQIMMQIMKAIGMYYPKEVG